MPPLTIRRAGCCTLVWIICYAHIAAHVTAGNAVAMHDWQPQHSRHLLQELKAKIAGGKDAKCGRFPYMVSLRDRNNNHKCGGVLIHPEWVLTAAHCVDPTTTATLGSTPIVVVGSCKLDELPDTTNGNGRVQFTTPRRTILHPKWNGDVSKGNDIALLQLVEGPNRTTVALPQRDQDYDINALALGWGSTSNAHQSDVLQEVALQLITNEACAAEDVWGPFIKKNMVCAFGFGRGADGSLADTCEGDSGGPLLHAFAPGGDTANGVPEVDYIVGITSFGEETKRCTESQKPGVYTRVVEYLDWIGETADVIPVTQDHLQLDDMPDHAHQEPKISALASPSLEIPVPAPEMNEPQPLALEVPDSEPPQSPPSPTAVPDVITPQSSALEVPESMPPQSPPSPTPVPGSLSRQEQVELDKKLLAAVSSKLSTTEEVEILLLMGANPDARDPDEPRKQAFALHLAVFYKKAEIAAVLIKAGATIDSQDKDGSTPLHYAADFDAPNSARLLVQKGADVLVADNLGRTALHLAAMKKNAVVASLLADELGAVKAEDEKGLTPLHDAAQVNDLQIGKVLIDGGANVNSKAHDGETPLHIAAKKGSLDFVSLLLANGSNKNVEDNFGNTPVETVCARALCKKRKLQRLKQLLA